MFARQSMSTPSAQVFVEFRCNRCWYSNCANSEAVGMNVECRNCGHTVNVPEATPDRIARAEALLNDLADLVDEKQQAGRPKSSEFDRDLNDRELVELANRQSIVPLNQMDFQGYPPVSILARLVAVIVDNVLVFTSIAAGFVLVAWLAKLGIGENPMDSIRSHKELGLLPCVLLSALPTLLVIGQWFLLATSGQTIGKKLMMIRIVSTDGKLTGFLQAVVLRNWLRAVFSFVPFFGLIDLLFIFTDSRRCLHDYFAGTKVVGIA